MLPIEQKFGNAKNVINTGVVADVADVAAILYKPFDYLKYI